MMIATRQASTPKIERFFDQLAIYSATIFPIVWQHARPYTFGWFTDYDLVRILPMNWAKIAEVLYWIITISYFLYHLLQNSFLSKRFIIWITTWFSWSLGFYWFDDMRIVSLVLIAFTHGFPYLILLYSFHNRSTIFQNLNQYKPIFYYGFLLLVSLPRYFLYIKVVDGTLFTETSLIFLVPLLTLPDIVHYIFDTYLWKVKLNPILKEKYIML